MAVVYARTKSGTFVKLPFTERVKLSKLSLRLRQIRYSSEEAARVRTIEMVGIE